ncbi:MAG TPA: tetratricopeptide repeat protein, partial [Sandaracinaceae bacterium LLY-WYZ-13_1]|nr:tetratricopeptide repeat protein [Sandaracinaceae bacterium LLY-WYZ-13_1]
EAPPAPTQPVQGPSYDAEPPSPTQPAHPVPRHEPEPPSLTQPATESPPAPRRRLEKNIQTARVPVKSRAWLPWVAVGGVALILLGVAATIGISAWMEASEQEAIRAAAAAAGDSGRREDLEAALARVEGSEEPAMQALEARLLATLTLEHDDDRAERARAILSALPASNRPTDASIASALLSVDQGDPAAALQVLSGLPAEGEQIPEAYRARAFATAALGRWSQAAEAAGHAVEARPSAPRHVTLQALMRHRTGDSSGALTLLDGISDGASRPAVRVARARILQESGSDPARAVEEATAVIDELADRATPHELAWAHLVRAKHAAAQGDGATAVEEARAAAEHPPPADEAFGLAVVRTLLRAGDAAAADEHLGQLPEPVVDQAARAMLTSEVALAVGDLDRAEAALAGAEDGPRKSLLQAQILEARGRLDEARPLYEEAMEVPGPAGRRARVRLAAIELAEGNASRAIELLEPARAGAVDDLELVPLLARAYLTEDRLDDAQEVLDGALRRRPEAAELLAARGALQLRRGDVDEALASLRRAAEARPQDPNLQADLGEAARQAGEAGAAREAFEAALRLREDHPRALLGLAQLAFAAGELEEAEERLDAAAETGQHPLEVARLRGQLFVARGDGASAVEAMQALAEEHEDDAALWTALGALQAQAEQDRDAGRSFERAQRLDRGHPQAHLGQSLIEIRRGDLGGARRAIATAEREAEERGLSEALAPWLAVAQGRLEFEMGDFDETVELANRAIEADPQFAAAHLLLANVAIERGDDGIEHLRHAAEGHTTPPEALGRLAPRLPRGEEACRVAERYLEVAPQGYDAPAVRRVAARCD